ADFEAHISHIIGAAVFTVATVPAHHIPRQGLVGSNGAVLQFSDEGMATDLLAFWFRLIPVVTIRVFLQEAVVWAYVTLEVGIVGVGRMNHDALDCVAFS